MNPDQIKQDWNSRGYSFGVFRDPPGRVWADFVHRTDELVVLITRIADSSPSDFCRTNVELGDWFTHLFWLCRTL